MRLRLRVQRNELPAVNTLWPLSDTQQKHTIAQLLEAINQTFPLETDKWGLEDYVVTVASYECLHYHEIGAVCKDEDEVVVRPLTYAEVRARTLMGRSQISGDGRKLEDGIAFGRPLLRAPVRPKVRIPARKRKRGGEDEEDDEGDKRVRFLNNEHEGEQTEAAPLPNHKTVVVVSGKDDDSEEDEDDEEDDQDFELEDDASSSEAESDSSKASSSSSGSDSSDSTESSDSSDSSSSSSSDSSSDESSKARAKASRAKRTASSVKPISQTATKLNTKTLPDTTKQTNSGAPQPVTIPHEGKRTTQERNARRRDSKKLTYLKENGILPPSADLMALRAWEKTSDWITQAPGLTKHTNATETSSSTMQGTEDPSEEVDLATQRQQLLQSIASGGVEIGANGKAVREESGDEGPEVHSNRMAAEHAALTERLYRENINSMTEDASASPGAPNRRGLDMSSAERLLYGSLGVRAPKTQEQKDALQRKLAGRQGTAAPKSKSKAQPKQPDIAEAEAEEEDPDAWLQRIDLRAVECCEEGVELSTPPFPFYQRWDSQYRKKKNRNMAAYANAPRKRRRGNQGNMVGEFVESYDKYNQDGSGDVLDYDGDGAGDEDWDQDDLAEQQLLSEVNANLPVDDFPALPENVSSLPALTSEDAQSGDYVTYTELVCSPATSWQPLMLTRTVQLMEKDGENWKVKLAVRDLPPKEYDADGNRVYGKFEMEEMSDDGEESGEDERVKVMAFADLNEARLLERVEVEVATAAAEEA
jgi:hypothetical protein